MNKQQFYEQSLKIAKAKFPMAKIILAKNSMEDNYIKLNEQLMLQIHGKQFIPVVELKDGFMFSKFAYITVQGALEDKIILQN